MALDIIPRKSYMDGIVTHREYYGQFVNEHVKRTLLMYIPKEDILASTDKHLNDIPLIKWDRLSGYSRWPREGFNLHGQPASMVRQLSMANAGGGVSASDLVCVYKEAAKQVQEEEWGVDVPSSEGV
jgi:hypothetical protein